MPSIPAKYAVEVTAGIVPGRPISELTKTFWVTSDEWHETRDIATVKAKWDEANEYARTLVDPVVVNWVSVHWLWF